MKLNFSKYNLLVVQFFNMYQNPYVPTQFHPTSRNVTGPGLGSGMQGKKEDRVPAPKGANCEEHISGRVK